jgi:hypothetical protein
MHAKDGGAMLLVDGIGGKVDAWLVAGDRQPGGCVGQFLLLECMLEARQMAGGKGLLQILEQSCIVTFVKQKHWHQLLSGWWVVDGRLIGTQQPGSQPVPGRARLPHVRLPRES